MKTFNALMTGLFDLLFRPFRSVDPMWPLLIVSFLTGILMLWMFGKLSDQDAVRTVRDKIRGNLIGVRLFGDDLAVLFRLQGRILWQTAVYLRYAFVPMLILFLPVGLILTQLNLRFASRPLEVGETAVVQVAVDDPVYVRDPLALESPDGGVAIETPPVRVPALSEVSWRIRAARPGDHVLRVRVGDETVEKTLRVGSPWGATSTLRTGRGFFESLLYPGEAPIPRGKVRAIEVAYPDLDLSAFGFSVNWLLFFFIASIVFGFAFRKPLGVEI